MPRSVILGPRLLASLSRIGVRPGTPRSQQFNLQLGALGSAELPGPDDYQTGLPPVLTAWVRPIKRVSLWAFYTFDADKVVVLFVKDTPPIPLG